MSSRGAILVIDDDPEVREFIATALRAEDFDVWLAADGWKALDVAGERTPDLIILDVNLPGIDGEAVATGLRLMQAAPVLIVTGMPANRDTQQRLGGYATLRKPFAVDALLELVYLGLKRSEP
jgi:DNA-binding response OmpR family regulator